MPRHNSVHSLAVKHMPQLRELHTPLVSPSNLLTVDPPRAGQDFARLAGHGWRTSEWGVRILQKPA